MADRWRGRAAALAIALALATGAWAVADRQTPALRVSLPDGTVVARLSLPADGSFSLRYRNSLYGTLAEERFVVTPGGVLRLVELGADQLAVLEEYYAIETPARRAPGTAHLFAAEPARETLRPSLRVAATDLGERTLLIDGHPPLELWRLVDDASPAVLLEADR
jgi:hypothetical protein